MIKCGLQFNKVYFSCSASRKQIFWLLIVLVYSYHFHRNTKKHTTLSNKNQTTLESALLSLSAKFTSAAVAATGGERTHTPPTRPTSVTLLPVKSPFPVHILQCAQQCTQCLSGCDINLNTSCLYWIQSSLCIVWKCQRGPRSTFSVRLCQWFSCWFCPFCQLRNKLKHRERAARPHACTLNMLVCQILLGQMRDKDGNNPVSYVVFMKT